MAGERYSGAAADQEVRVPDLTGSTSLDSLGADPPSLSGTEGVVDSAAERPLPATNDTTRGHEENTAYNRSLGAVGQLSVSKSVSTGRAATFDLLSMRSLASDGLQSLSGEPLVPLGKPSFGDYTSTVKGSLTPMLRKIIQAGGGVHARRDARLAKYAGDGIFSSIEDWRSFHDQTILEVFGSPKAITGGRPYHRYFEVRQPKDREKADVGLWLLEGLSEQGLACSFKRSRRNGRGGLIEEIEGFQQQAVRALRAEVHITDGEFDNTRLAGYFEALGLPSAEIIALDTTKPPTSDLERMLHRKFEGQPNRQGVYMPELDVILLNLPSLANYRASRVHIEAHERAHCSGAFSVVGGRMRRNRVFFWPKYWGMQSNGFFEGRAELLGAHGRVYVEGSPSGRSWIPSPWQGAQDAIARIQPLMYDRGLHHNKLEPMTGPATSWAVNLELLIGRQPSLFDSVLYAGRSPDDMRTLLTEFNTLQPGLYGRWRDIPSDQSSDGLYRRGMAMTQHILTTLYGVGRHDVAKALDHINQANQLVHTLIETRLSQVEEPTT